uniref:Uncharacterized protein n=1 Tax=Leersia perrieri TaxID=77586 RepID=A0A0D9XZM1_9ORYZ
MAPESYGSQTHLPGNYFCDSTDSPGSSKLEEQDKDFRAFAGREIGSTVDMSKSLNEDNAGVVVLELGT